MIESLLFESPITYMILCEMVCITAFSIRKQNTGNVWAGKFVIACVIILLVMVLDYQFVDSQTASTALEAPLCFAAAAIFAKTTLEYPMPLVLYCGVWSYLFTDMTTQIIMPLSGRILQDKSAWFYYPGMVFLFTIGIFGVFTIVSRVLGQKLRVNGNYHVGRQKILLSIMILIIYMLLSNYQFLFWLMGGATSESSNMITVFRLVLGAACMIFLYMQNSIEKQQRAEQELNTMQQLWYRQQNQYKMSQENIELINRKCHDLKYQMEVLRKLKDSQEIDQQLSELERSVMIYDSVIETGNPVLDTVLTEKSLYCEANHIQLTCMVDGRLLDFIGKVDLYTMFANALDNAVENVMKLKEVEKRVIQVSVFKEKELLFIRVRNYCEEKLIFSDGLPVSTKSDKHYHGYGLKSIRYTVEKYGGGLACRLSGNYFVLQILLPVKYQK